MKKKKFSFVNVFELRIELEIKSFQNLMQINFMSIFAFQLICCLIELFIWDVQYMFWEKVRCKNNDFAVQNIIQSHMTALPNHKA